MFSYFFIKLVALNPIFYKEKQISKIRPMLNTEKSEFEIFQEVVDSFGESNDDMIQQKEYYFQ